MVPEACRWRVQPDEDMRIEDKWERRGIYGLGGVSSMNNLMRKILLRRSIYNFSDTTLRDADLLSILEEGRVLSNVEKNASWHFTAVQNSNVIRMLLDSTGQQTVGRLGVVNGRDLYSGSDLLKNIPTLLVISGSGDAKYAEDAANTLFGSMMLAAEKYNVCSCWLSTRSELSDSGVAEICHLLQIPDDYVPLSIGAFGYKMDEVKITALSNLVNIIR